MEGACNEGLEDLSSSLSPTTLGPWPNSLISSGAQVLILQSTNVGQDDLSGSFSTVTVMNKC